MTTAAAAPLRAADAARAGCLPRKTFDCHVKAMDEDGSFTLYAAVFDNIDRQGDVIERGAFANLDEFQADGWIALNHNNSELPIAYPTEARQDEKGLLISGRFHTTAAAQEARTVMRERRSAGKAVKCSIGYLTHDESFEKQEGRMVRRIKKLSVYEASIVNLPANPAAEVTSVKGADPMSAEKDPESKSQDLLAEALQEIKDLKEVLTKGNGNAPKSAYTRLKAFAQAMDEHGCGTRDHAKAMGLHGAAARALAREMKAVLKAFAGGDEADEADEADEEEEEEGQGQAGKGKGKGKEKDKEKDKDKGPAPRTRDDDAKSAYHAQLKHRALTGRRATPRP